MISASEVMFAYDKGLLSKQEASFVIRELINKTVKMRTGREKK